MIRGHVFRVPRHFQIPEYMASRYRDALKVSADMLGKKRVEVTIRGESRHEQIYRGSTCRFGNELHSHCSITSTAQMRSSQQTHERPNKMVVIDVCILSTLNVE